MLENAHIYSLNFPSALLLALTLIAGVQSDIVNSCCIFVFANASADQPTRRLIRWPIRPHMIVNHPMIGKMKIESAQHLIET